MIFSIFKENNHIFKLSQLSNGNNNGCFPQFFNRKYKFSRDSILYRIGPEIKLQKFVVVFLNRLINKIYFF